MFSDNTTSSQAYLAFSEMMQKYHRKINIMFLTYCLDISLPHCYTPMLQYTMPLPTSWQGIILGKGSGILLITLISEQMQKKKKGPLSGEKVGREPEPQNCNSFGDQVRENGLTHTQACVMLLILFIQLTVLKSKQLNYSLQKGMRDSMVF